MQSVWNWVRTKMTEMARGAAQGEAPLFTPRGSLSMNGWKIVVWGLLPPPLVLTTLLVVPMPRVIGRGLLAFAKSVLFCPVLGGILLVHFMLLVTGVMLVGGR